MVKLKSFRYIEPDSQIQTSLARAPEDDSQTGSEANNSQQQQQQQYQKQQHRNSTSGSSSLPSNEEYQGEEFELLEEADEEEDQQEGSGSETKSSSSSSSSSRKLDQQHHSVITSSSSKQPHRGSVTIEQAATGNGQRQQNQESSVSLAALRNQFLAELTGHTQADHGVSEKQQAAATARLVPSSLSPILNRAGLDVKSSDSVSQYHFRQGAPSGQQVPMSTFGDAFFEIKWRSLNLYAKRPRDRNSLLADTWRRLSGRMREAGLKQTKSGPINQTTNTNTNTTNTSISNTNAGSPAALSAAYMMASPPQAKLRRSASIQSDQSISSLDLKQISTVLQIQQQQLNADLINEFPPTDYRPILQNVSGSVYAGQLTAILGPSGVGKSTLLNTLTGRNQLAGVGRVSLIGCSERRVSVVFVPQWDVLPEQLTTLEDLEFTSQLKNPRYTSEQHRANVSRIVKLLQLDQFLHVRIKSLSGGQARRLSIGRELLGSPDIMILDEPTSGLDANTCKKIIQALRDLTEQSDNLLERPMSIIVTIHQPQQEVYKLFHRVYLMALGGRSIYEGPPDELMSTFLENSALPKIVPPEQLNENPAVVALEVASGEYGEAIIDDLERYHQSVIQDRSPFATPSIMLRNTPKILRSPKVDRSPAGSPLTKTSGHRMTPKLKTRAVMAQSPLQQIKGGLQQQVNNQQQPFHQWDKMSAVTTVSYASTYDADLPEPIAPKLKVDKRLRRSVVVQNDFIRQTWTLMRRSWRLATRDVFLMCVRIIGFICVAGGTIQIFSGALDPNDNQCPQYASQVDDMKQYMTETRSRLRGLENFLKQSFSARMYFFQIVVTMMMITAALTGLVFPIQIRMFLREYKNGWYSVSSFIMSNTLSELLIDFMGPTILVVTTYQLCHQPESMYHWRELAYIVITILSALIIKSQSQIVSSFLKNSVENAVFMSCVAVVLPIFTSGICVAIYNLPGWLQTISSFSYGRWTYEGLLLIRYGYDICPCDPSLVNGYPVTINEDAVPARLHTFSQSLLTYYTDSNATMESTSDQTNSTITTTQSPQESSLFGQFVKLASSAANPLITSYEELGDCSTYRSLALMEMGIPDRVLPQMLSILGVSFILFRILTYLSVRAVIKLDPVN